LEAPEALQGNDTAIDEERNENRNVIVMVQDMKINYIERQSILTKIICDS
jgi:hypothetical protein